ncbi:hypothetical protein JCM11251_003925 [Rhodosporidiobolus azoricus]
MDQSEPPAGKAVTEAVAQYNRHFQAFLDRTTPFTFRRWGTTGGLFVIFTLRILWVQAYYIVAYALGYALSSG